MHGLIFNVNVELQRNPGGHRIATILRKNSWDIEVFDFAYHAGVESLKEFVRQRYSSKTRFFAFGTFFSQWHKQLDNFTLWLKNKYPDVPIIIGGQSVNLTPAKNIDYWVDSYAENAIFALLRDICNHSSGPAVRFDKSYKDRKAIQSIKDYPAFPLTSYATEYQKRDYLQEHEWLMTEFGRGCKFKCSFCNYPILGVKGDHTRTQDDFERELKTNYDNWGIKHYYVADETFNDSPQKIKKFAQVVDSKINFSPYFAAFNRLDLLAAHPETWDDFKTLGMYGHHFGVETFHRPAAKNIGKGMHPDKLKQSLLNFRHHMSGRPFRANTSFIIGLPKEPKESFMQTIDWLKKNWSNQRSEAFYLAIDQRTATTNISDISRDPNRYGIRQLSKAQFSKLYKEKIAGKNYPKSHFLIEEGYLWTHDQMNILEAFELDMQFKSLFDDQPSSMWCLDHVVFVEEQPIDQCARLTESGCFVDNEFSFKKNQFVEDYIAKKLNYRY